MATHCPKCNTENPSDSKYCKECATPLPAPEEFQASFTKTLLTPVEDLMQGTLFAGRYKIIEELGKGGMGKVYKALDNEIHEEVAIKLLKPEIAADEKIIERFRNELKIARKITHENVCQTYHIGKEESTPYITMEYVPGEDLKNLITKKGQLPKEEALGIAKQVCEGLVVAHKLGVVHRDLKPQNIMIDESGNAKIMDFGLARSVEAEGVTEAGMIIGTPDYISPEQAEGEEADHRSDIYSLGVILYEMVTGTVPFKGNTALSVALKHKSQFPLDPRKLNPDVSDDLSRLILICMEKDRERRYQTAEALLNDLRNIEEGLPLGTKIKPRRPTFTQTLIRRKLFIPAMVIVLAIITIAIWQLLPRGEAVIAPKIENSLAIISFENLTGDNNNDFYQRSIPNLLITNLESTGYFYVPTWERMRDLLKQMGKSEVEFIDSNMGFELCRREGVEALVVGSLNKAGNMFVTDVKVYDVETKKSIKSVNSKGIGAQSIFESQIDDLSRKISAGIGLAQEKIEAAKLQISEVTTTSMDAYNYYLEGREQQIRWYLDEARQSYEKAIELDPTFASAYYHLAVTYFRLKNIKAGNEALEKAKAFSHKATEKERLLINASYAGQKENDREKWFHILQQLTKKYPNEKETHFELGKGYWGREEYHKAFEEWEEAFRLDPNDGRILNEIAWGYQLLNNLDKALEYSEKSVDVWPEEPNPLDTMAFIYWRMGKLDEAIAAYKEAINIKPDFWPSVEQVSIVYAMKENYDEAIKWIDTYISIASPYMKRNGYLYKGFYQSWIGNFEQSLLSYQRAYELGEAFEDAVTKAEANLQLSAIYYDREELELSRKNNEGWSDDIDGVIEIYPQLGPYQKFGYSYVLGLIDLKEGNVELAKTRLEEMKTAFPDFPSNRVLIGWGTTILNFFQAEIWLLEGFYERAIALLEEASPQWPLAGDVDALITYQTFFLKDVLARAYQRGGELDKAIKEYERLITFDPERKDRFLVHPKYHYRLAMLYEEKGQERKAIEQYEKFLDLWKDADPGIAEVEEAKERLAGLKGQ